MTLIKNPSTGRWVQVAGGQRMWIGTKEQMAQDILSGAIPSDSVVLAMVTNDGHGEGSPIRRYSLNVNQSVTIPINGAQTIMLSPVSGTSSDYVGIYPNYTYEISYLVAGREMRGWKANESRTTYNVFATVSSRSSNAITLLNNGVEDLEIFVI